MASQVKKKVVAKTKAVADKVVHSQFMKTYIPAGLASSAPPLGTMLGQIPVMASQVKKKVVAKTKAVADKVVHSQFMKTYIPAGLASSAPPLGTMLGQRGINIANFVKDFNEQTKNIKDGVPMVTRVQVTGDRSYILEILKPPVSYFIKQAAGIRRGAMNCGKDVAGFITLKHVYEIAKYKLDDINCAHYSIERMCINVLNAARQCGVKVVKHDLDAEEMREFLKAREEVIKKEKAELSEKRAAKLMRASNAAAATAAAGAKK